MHRIGKRMVLLVTWIVGIVIVIAAGLSIASRFIDNHIDNHGLDRGKLKPCTRISNCVCTESYPNNNFHPINIGQLTAPSAWELLRNVIVATGGKIELDKDGYLWATYSTPLLRFVDDLEARIDESGHVIHLRSASRVGRSDLGANKQRMENIAAKFRDSAG